MSNPIISVEHLSKRYLVGHQSARNQGYTALRDVLARNARNLLRTTRDMFTGRQIIQGDEVEEFWALQDVSFDVQPGEVVGIIGRNGAGKSTLLKILSRITESTSGRVTLHGRVASLLEVGTGFHPELTGRENVFLNGAILGMTRAEVRRKFDEIVAFAEVDRFLDTPVKRYSSGMYVRLAFAVAAHLDPEIFVVDEVLAVGDAAFQKKCLGKMGQVAEGGRTVLFVSHNLSAVKNMCTRGILLDHGRVKCSADIDTAINEYMRQARDCVKRQQWSLADAPGTRDVKLLSIQLATDPPVSVENLTINDPFRFEIRYLVTDPELKINLSVSVFNAEGACVFSSPSIVEKGWFDRPVPYGLCLSTCEVPGNLLNNGRYTVKLLFVHDTTRILHVFNGVLEFEVLDDFRNRGNWYGDWPGTVRPFLQWRTLALPAGAADNGPFSAAPSDRGAPSDSMVNGNHSVLDPSRVESPSEMTGSVDRPISESTSITQLSLKNKLLGRTIRMGNSLRKICRYNAARLGMLEGPSFLIVGAQKAGTTSLHQYLTANPCFFGAVEKELSFFDQDVNFNRGRAWYLSHFPIRARFRQPYQMFEATPEYLYYPQAPNRIREFNRDVRIIILLRDPVDRAFSAWNMMCYRGANGFRVSKEQFDVATEISLNEFHSQNPLPSFESCARNEIETIEKGCPPLEPGFIRRGLYADQVQRYFELFDREQILIMDFRSFKKSPGESLKKVTDFLQMPAFDWGNDFPVFLKGEYKERISDESRTLLSNFYRPHNQSLYSLLGEDFGWK